MAKIIVILLVPDKLIQKRSKYREIFEPQYVIVLSQIISGLYRPLSSHYDGRQNYYYLRLKKGSL